LHASRGRSERQVVARVDFEAAANSVGVASHGDAGAFDTVDEPASALNGPRLARCGEVIDGWVLIAKCGDEDLKRSLDDRDDGQFGRGGEE
jgi:hypothetical protein